MTPKPARRKARQFTPEETALIVRRYVQNWPIHEIALEIRCDKALVREWLEDNGFPPQSKFRVATPEQRAEIERMYDKGIAKSRIATVVGVGHITLARWMGEWGLNDQAQLRPTDEQEALLRQLFAEGVSVLSMAGHPQIRKSRRIVTRWLGVIGLSVADRKAEALAKIQVRNEAKKKRQTQPRECGKAQQPQAPKKEKAAGAVIRISSPAPAPTRLPPDHLSIAEKFRRGEYNPQPVSLEGYRIKYLGEGPAHQRLELEELLAFEVEPDRFG